MTKGRWLGLAALALVGCRHRVPLTEICKPEPDRTVLCLYRADRPGRINEIEVDGQTLVALRNDEWVELAVSAGKHELSVTPIDTGFPPEPTVLPIDAMPGGVVALRVETAWTPPIAYVARPRTVDVVPVDLEAARAEIQSECDRIAPWPQPRQRAAPAGPKPAFVPPNPELCPAQSQPGWADASALQKREMLRRCRGEP